MKIAPTSPPPNRTLRFALTGMIGWAGLVAAMPSGAAAQDPFGVFDDQITDASVTNSPNYYFESPLESPTELASDSLGETLTPDFANEEDVAEVVIGDSLDQSVPTEPETLPLFPTGLLKSRWAMSDPGYAQKYARGAKKTNFPKKIKQAADARFVNDFSGRYFSGGLTSMSNTPSPMGSLEIGYTGYHTSYLTNRMGFILAANDQDYYIGGETGLRLQTPTRLAPFVGAGLFLGVSSTHENAEHDNIDNDDNGSVDEDGETEFRFDGALAAVYPECGVHFWWSPRIRLSGFGRYMITTEGRNADTWYFGATIAVLSR
ncbi:hypothetical protein [Rubripirellula reticaptiva]|uniref:Outer membrane protein beta-barrel domain-containing protein n=1 Tax=Rubripirellula reticaptiva TaxID=2528013 RepID=A0A5C6F2I0_9BACT|nr:hypothetical protein [Rubripirellula reticaptiva]TWU55325.1 hypothetical protein Poly59_16220 [Rubripirellula reticaptiva]